jgi:hypothetical protein
MRFGSLLIASLLACTPGERQLPDDDPERERERARMVIEQLRGRDIHSPRVLDAMRAVPRHLFVPDATAISRCPSATARPSRSRTSSPS